MTTNIRPYRMVPIIVVVLMIAMYLKPTISSLLRQLYREERIARQLYESGADDVELSEHRIITIDFDQQPATDAVLQLIEDCDQLESLSLNCSIVTDARLAHLSRLARLSALEISLEDSPITKTGLEAFRSMRGLRHLEIKDAPTDLSCFENATVYSFRKGI